MKSLIAALTIALLAGCTTRTDYGACVGAFDDKDPKFVWKLSVWNTALAIIFIETVFVPIVVIANETHCPVEKK